jgi:anti-sigma factor RsiW
MSISTPAALDCQQFVELVTAYLEGSLDDDTARRVETHLDLCHPCVTYLDQVRQTVAALGTVPLGTLSDDSRQELLAAFRAARLSGT